MPVTVPLPRCPFRPLYMNSIERCDHEHIMMSVFGDDHSCRGSAFACQAASRVRISFPGVLTHARARTVPQGSFFRPLGEAGPALQSPPSLIPDCRMCNVVNPSVDRRPAGWLPEPASLSNRELQRSFKSLAECRSHL